MPYLGGGKIIKYRFSPQLQQELIHIDYSRIDYHFVEKFKHKIDHPLQIDDIEWLSSLRIK